jgi:hypothetical protein
MNGGLANRKFDTMTKFPSDALTTSSGLEHPHSLSSTNKAVEGALNSFSICQISSC